MVKLPAPAPLTGVGLALCSQDLFSWNHSPTSYSLPCFSLLVHLSPVPLLLSKDPASPWGQSLGGSFIMYLCPYTAEWTHALDLQTEQKGKEALILVGPQVGYLYQLSTLCNKLPPNSEPYNIYYLIVSIHQEFERAFSGSSGIKAPTRAADIT